MSTPSPMPTIPQLEADIKVVRAALRLAGVPEKLLNGVRTRAQQTGRKVTGQHQTNRQARWRVPATNPQYGTELDCKMIHLQLLGMMCEFVGAPTLDTATSAILARYIGHPPVPGTYRDALTLEKLSYDEFRTEVMNPTHGHSAFHIGHEDPTIHPKHVASNVAWRDGRSNLIQGNMTLRESRTKLVELVARYFELGEVTIVPD